MLVFPNYAKNYASTIDKGLLRTPRFPSNPRELIVNNNGTWDVVVASYDAPYKEIR